MSSRSVLVVDDERNIRATLRAALESVASDVREAPDGLRGLDELRRAPAAVVLLDLRMPVLDGMETLRRIRSEAPDTRVVVITAHGTVDAAVEAMKLGASDFLQKPFEPGEVRRVVTALLGGGPAAETGAAADVAALLAEARECVRRSEFTQAEHAARCAVALAPGDADPLFVLGVVRDRRGERLDAQKYYRAAIALRADLEHAHRNLSRSVDGASSEPLLLGDEPLGRKRS